MANNKQQNDKARMIERLDDLQVPDIAIIGDNANTFASHISGARDGIALNQRRQGTNLADPESPGVATGYEGVFGKHSTLGLVKADDDLKLMAMFEKDPNNRIYLFRNLRNQKVEIQVQGYFINVGSHFALKCEDNIKTEPLGAVIKKGNVITRGSSFDANLNYQYGTNLMTAFVSTPMTYEDSLFMSTDAGEKLSHYQKKTYSIPLSSSEFFLNQSDEPGKYKCIPDLMETIDKPILAVVRRRSSVSSFVDSKNENMHIDTRNLSDKDIAVMPNSTIIDVNVWLNSNPEELRLHAHNEQLLHYYDKNMKFYTDFVVYIRNVIENEGEHVLSDEVRTKYIQYSKFADSVKKTPGRGGKEFDNIYIELTVITKYPGITGSKITDRAAGKGVCGEMRHPEDMPMTEDGIVAQVGFNPISVFKRQITIQMIESELQWVGREVVKKAVTDFGIDNRNAIINEIMAYIDFVADMESQRDTIINILSSANQKQWQEYIDHASYWGINIICKPFTNKFCANFIHDLYKVQYPWLKKPKVFWKGRKTIEDPIIAPKYYICLEHTPDSKLIARASGFVNPVTGPVKRKGDYIIPKSALKMGYMEYDVLQTLSSLKDPNNAAIEFKVVNGSSTRHREDLFMQLLTKPAKDVQFAPEDIALYPQDSTTALEAYNSCLGMRTITLHNKDAQKLIKSYERGV